jgi:DNA repair exonuclease SbcCD ATPase subunit
LEKDKELVSKKLKDLEAAKEDLSGKPSSSSDKKSKEELSKLQKENQNLKKEKDDLGKSLKSIEKDLKKNIKDVKPNKVQGELKKLADKIESNSLLADVGAAPYMNGVDGDASAIKSNFDALQKDYESRTGEIEKLTSQLARAKTDSNSAVEKLRKSESELAQIKEKNAQLSDELLNKSRVITGMANGGQDTTALQKQVDDLKKKVAEGSGGAKVKKSVKFSVEPEAVSEPSRGVKDLEDALEAAYKERNDIIDQCRKEVEFHRTIASELENSIMEVGFVS